MRYFLIDRIEELSPFRYAIGKKAVALSEDCFEQHFPGQPVYPGALLIEGMAQLGGALLELSLRDAADHCPRCVMSTVKAKFRDFVHPGDVLTFRAEIVSRHEESALVRVSGEREGKRVCQAEVLYVLLRIDDERLEASRRDFLSTITRGMTLVQPDEQGDSEGDEGAAGDAEAQR
jgi:3-hydroxyacyl-[acyl-carrier-protein] dehydratase